MGTSDRQQKKKKKKEAENAKEKEEGKRRSGRRKKDNSRSYRMAEIAVNVLLNKLWLVSEEEVKLFRGVWKDFEYIRNEFGCIKAVLTADAKDENDLQLEWIKQLRNIAYETEDVLDEFILRLGHHQGHGVCHSLYKIALSIKNFRARRRIAAEFLGIKSRVNDICLRHERYLGKFNVPSSATTATVSYHDSRLDAFLLDEAKLVGIEEPKKEIINLLVDDNRECKIICVVGMGGLGKTTLVRSIYNDAEVKKKFPRRAWITISQSFNEVELLEQLIVQLFDGSEEECSKVRDDKYKQIRLKEIIRLFLEGKRYLIALDDVWEKDGWDFFKLAFPNNEHRSRLMLTTRNTTVATSACIDMGHRGKVHHLKSLSLEDSRTLFCRKIFPDKVCPDNFKDVAEELLKRCEGLPLAVETISGMLAKDVRIERWEMVNRSLDAELESERMNKILSLSYDDLPYHLKPCLLYASIFPRDHLMERMRLIRLWIAEGFVVGINGRTLEEVADGYLNELLNRNLLQIATTTVDARVMKCRIHDLLRDILVSKARHENFAMQVCPENAGGPRIVRRLTIHQSSTNIVTNMDISHLRSLLVFGEEHLSPNLPILKLSHARFKPLKVLDLQGVTMETFPKEVIKLYHLGYLSLRDTNVKMIPSSIGKLQYLETFDLRGTNVAELPVEILKLHRLRHLLVYKYVNSSRFDSGKRGSKAPMGIGGLLSLQKLSCIEVNEGNDLIRELGDLKQLRSLRISNLRRQQGNVVCSSIQKLTNLVSLFLVSKTPEDIVDLQYFSSVSSPPPSLQRLYLEGRLDKLPRWISSLPKLAKVQLSWSKLQDDVLESLYPLPSLIELQLYQAYDGRELRFRAGGFPRLRKLLLYSLVELRLVAAERSSLPCLEVVQIIDCPSLERQLPEGFVDLINLKSVEFGEMPNEFHRVIRVQDVRIRRFANLPKSRTQIKATIRAAEDYGLRRMHRTQ